MTVENIAIRIAESSKETRNLLIALTAVSLYTLSMAYAQSSNANCTDETQKIPLLGGLEVAKGHFFVVAPLLVFTLYALLQVYLLDLFTSLRLFDNLKPEGNRELFPWLITYARYGGLLGRVVAFVSCATLGPIVLGFLASRAWPGLCVGTLWKWAVFIWVTLLAIGAVCLGSQYWFCKKILIPSSPPSTMWIELNRNLPSVGALP